MMTGHPFDMDPNDPETFAWVQNASWYHYLEGYGEAIHILLGQAEPEDGIPTTAGDFLVFPIAFLCRHSLELRLKELIDTGNRSLAMNEGPFGHDLQRLWQSCRRVILKAWPNTPDSQFSFIDELIIGLVAVDPESTSFRYPRKRDGRPSLPVELSKFSLRILVERVDEASRLIDGAATGIEEGARLQAEVED